MRVSDTSTRGVVTPSEARGLLFSADRRSRFIASLGMTLVGAVTLLLILGSMMSTAAAQIIGPGPKQGKLQFGGWWAFMHYDQLYRYARLEGEWTLKKSVPRDRAALVLRYGVTDQHYLIMNFGLLKKQSEYDDGSKFSSMEGVWGIGGNATLFSLTRSRVRLGAEYNDVFWYQEDRLTRPWRGRDARAAVALDHTFDLGHLRVTPAFGLLGFSAREKVYDGSLLIREKNRHYLSPLVAGIATLAGRVSLGLELTFGAITDFRWRTEIQL